MADFCHFEGDNIFNEEYSWVVTLAVVYLRVQYVTRDLFSAIAFVYLFEAFFLAMNLLYHYFMSHASRYHANSLTLWVAKNLLGIFATSEKSTFMCYESAMVALIAAPLVAVGAIVLWSFGAELLLGMAYKTTPSKVQHAILWPTFIIAVLIGPNALFAPMDNPHDVVYHKDAHIRATDPNTTVLFVTIIGVVLSSLIPLQSASENGFRSKKFWRAARAYVIYSIFSIFLAFFAELYRPSVVGSIGYQSSYSRTLVALATLYSCCVFFWLARFVYNTCWR